MNRCTQEEKGFGKLMASCSLASFRALSGEVRDLFFMHNFHSLSLETTTVKVDLWSVLETVLSQGINLIISFV